MLEIIDYYIVEFIIIYLLIPPIKDNLKNQHRLNEETSKACGSLPFLLSLLLSFEQ